MSATIFTLLFLAASPIIFMPSIIALLSRNHRKLWVVSGNLIVWVLGFVTIRKLANDSAGFFLPVPIAGVGWLGLLILAIKRPLPSDSGDGASST